MITIGNRTGTVGATPNKQGKVFSFTNETIDGSLTYTRTGTATRVNAQGFIESVPTDYPRITYDPATKECRGILLESSSTNLLTHTENFAAWGNKTGLVVVQNWGTSPNGSYNADMLISTTTGGSNTSYIDYGVSAVTASTVYTYSIYLKKGSSPTSVVNFYRSSPFSQVTGTVTWASNTFATAGADLITSSFVDAGNGWFRISLTMSSGTSTGMVCRVYTRDQGTANVIGDSVYVWGAQLEAMNFVTSYMPSVETWTGRATTATYYNSDGYVVTAASGVARTTYNPSNISVQPVALNEEASTNLLLWSEQFNQAGSWSTADTITANAVLAPDNTATGDKLVEVAVSQQHLVWQTVGTVSIGAVYTASIYAKMNERDKILITFYGEGYSVFDLAQGTVVQTGGNICDIQPVGNGWYRCSARCIKTNTNGTIYYGTWTTTNTFMGTVGSGLYIWGAQCELNGLTSYIPTVGATATRNADTTTSVGGNHTFDWVRYIDTSINANQGTVVAEHYYPNYSMTTILEHPVCLVGNSAISGNDSVRGGFLFLRAYSNGAGQLDNDCYGGMNISIGGWTSQFDTNGFVSTTPKNVKSGMSWAVNNISYSYNGLIQTDTSALIPTYAKQLAMGGGGGGTVIIKRLTYYSNRIADTALQALTK